MRAYSEPREIDVTISTADGVTMPLDAVRSVTESIKSMESLLQSTPDNKLTEKDVTDVSTILTGQSVDNVYKFTVTIDFTNGVYSYTFEGKFANAEEANSSNIAEGLTAMQMSTETVNYFDMPPFPAVDRTVYHDGGTTFPQNFQEPAVMIYLDPQGTQPVPTSNGQAGGDMYYLGQVDIGNGVEDVFIDIFNGQLNFIGSSQDFDSNG